MLDPHGLLLSVGAGARALLGWDPLALRGTRLGALVAPDSRLSAAGAPSPVDALLAAWRAEEPDLQIVDVRNPAEQVDGVVPGAVLVPLATLLDRLDELDREAPTVVYCAGGYRSSIAASLLRSHGFARVADLQGGYGAWAAAHLPVA